jgi:uncharacterized protein YuzE
MADQPDRPLRFSHYDPDVDIAWFIASDSRGMWADERPWGLIARDREDGSVAGIELWSASRYLPADLLAAMPRPGGQAG